MQFSKLEGLGNDFIVLNAEAVLTFDLHHLSRRICDRRFGVGADGVLFYQPVQPPSEADFKMRIFNADGGEAELSGNGLRCLAAHLFSQHKHKTNELVIETLAGSKRLCLIRSSPPEYWFEAEMGKPSTDRPRIACKPNVEPASLVGCELPVGDEVYSVTVTSLGNPHCSIFVDDFDSLAWERIGSYIEVHPYFPSRTNVEFVKVSNRSEIQVRFWERGVGKTLSSGTGSCAAVVASVLNGYTDRKLRVGTEGGEMEISWDDNNLLRLKGPAKIICDGEYYFDS